MRTQLLVSAALVAALCGSSATHAGDSSHFVGPYAPSSWSNSGITGGSTLVAAPLELNYHVDLGNPGGGVSPRSADYSAISTNGLVEVLTIDWTGFHAFFQAHAKLELFANTARGEVTVTVIDQSVSGNFALTATAAILTTPGLAWGVRVSGSNFDSNSVLDGHLRLHAVAPGDTLTPAQWSTTGMPGGTASIGTNDKGLNASYNVVLPGDGVGQRTATFMAIADATGPATFQWNYNGFHAFFLAEAYLRIFAVHSDGTQSLEVVNNEAVFDWFTKSGTITIDLEQGLVFGIEVGGKNFDSNSTLLGSVGLWKATLPRSTFDRCYAPSEWVTSGILEGTSEITGSGTPVAELTCSYAVDLASRGGGVSTRSVEYTDIAAGTGPTNFDWSWTGFHAYFETVATLEAFADGPDGTTSVLLYAGSPFGEFSFSGTTSITVHRNYAFGIRVTAGNYDSDSVVNGNVVLSGFTAPFCKQDLSCDGMVDGADLATLLGAWGLCDDCIADIDLDGSVGGADLAALLGAWGTVCE